MFCCTGAPHDSCRYSVSRVCGQLLLEWRIAQPSFLRKSIHQVSPEQGKNKSEIIYSFTISSLCRGNTVSKCFFSLRTQFPFLTWCSIFFSCKISCCCVCLQMHTSLSKWTQLMQLNFCAGIFWTAISSCKWNSNFYSILLEGDVSSSSLLLLKGIKVMLLTNEKNSDRDQNRLI